MKCLGKVIRTAHIENRDWEKALYSFLMAYRATPQPSTGVAPADLIYSGYRFKTLLPCPTFPDGNASICNFNDKAMAKSVILSLVLFLSVTLSLSANKSATS